MLLFTVLSFNQFTGLSYGQEFIPVDITTDKLDATGKGTPDTSSQYPTPESFSSVDITTEKLSAKGEKSHDSKKPHPLSPPGKK